MTDYFDSAPFGGIHRQSADGGILCAMWGWGKAHGPAVDSASREGSED